MTRFLIGWVGTSFALAGVWCVAIEAFSRAARRRWWAEAPRDPETTALDALERLWSES